MHPVIASRAMKAALFAMLCGASAAHADVTISTEASQNMSCSAGVCVPTATDAVLNTGDIQSMLASGNLAILTTNGGVQAVNIDVTASFSWTAANTLTLDAYGSITFTGAVSDGGTGGISLVTNDGGSGGALTFQGGRITISNVKDSLAINGARYKLETNIKAMAFDMVAHPDGDFALAASHDARGHGPWGFPPIEVPFGGTFNGLGNTISNLEIEDESDNFVGLFANLTAAGRVSGVRLDNALVIAAGAQAQAGGLVGTSSGTVANSVISGKVQGSIAGGLVGYNAGTILLSSSSAVVAGTDIGGLAGYDSGVIEQSFATGRIVGNSPSYSDAGGLAGDVFGQIQNSYASGDIRVPKGYAGGLMGHIDEQVSGVVAASYSTGRQLSHKGAIVGGFIGLNDGAGDICTDCYWDKTTSRTRIGVGFGAITGLTGLTTTELQSGLPAGFDPTIWAESPSINNGLPYLINNPPQ